MNKTKHTHIPELRFPEFKNDGDWEEKCISEILKYERPDNYIVSDTNYTEKGIPVLTANKTFILGYTNEDFGIYENLPAIIFDDFTTDSKFVDFPFKVKSSAIKILTPKKGDKLKFISELISLINFDAREHKRYYISEYQNIKVIIPSSKEQQKIAACLSSLDELIEGHSQKLELLEEHKKGLLQNLFPQKGKKQPAYRFPEFKNDGDWEEKTLGEVCDVSKLAGYEFTKYVTYERSGKIIALRGLNIKNNSLDLSDVKYIDNSDLSMLSRSKLYIDDLMFTYIGTIGEVALIEENDKYYLAPNVSRIRADKSKILPKYLLQHFNVPYFKNYEIKKFISSSSQPALTMSNVRKFKIKVPSKKEQQKIATCLSSLDELIKEQKQKIEQLKQHKRGLMQKLFVK